MKEERRRNRGTVGEAVFLVLALCALASVACADELVIELGGTNGLSFQPAVLSAYPNDTVVFVRDPGVQCTLFQTEQETSCATPAFKFHDDNTQGKGNFTVVIEQPGGTGIPYACRETCEKGGPRGMIRVLRAPGNATQPADDKQPTKTKSGTSGGNGQTMKVVLFSAGVIMALLVVVAVMMAVVRRRRHRQNKSLPPQPESADALYRLQGTASWNNPQWSRQMA